MWKIRSVQSIPVPQYPVNIVPSRRAYFPIPVRRQGALRLSLFNLAFSGRKIPEEQNEVGAPTQMLEIDVVTGEYVADTGVNLDRKERFGIADPPMGVVGHYDDPHRPPPDHLKALRFRIYFSMDLLLPLFAEQDRPWTEEANRAAREIRDFFPLAAEPGLWPYYKAEGKEFFAWVEKNAPPEKAVLPWDAAPPSR